jgi:hypothetical protein
LIVPVKSIGAILLVGFFLIMINNPAHAEEINTGRWKWDFEGDPANQAPSDFSFSRTGSGSMGKWAVTVQKDAPSGTNVLTQLDADPTSYRFPIAISDRPFLRDFRLSVRCKAVSGKVDQACGLVFRYIDENNYYISRANALEDNVRFYHVVAGKRTELASWSGRVTPRDWHELTIGAIGDLFEVFWDGKQIIKARDKTFSEPGAIGLWTKADSVTYFDDLIVEAR